MKPVLPLDDDELLLLDAEELLAAADDEPLLDCWPTRPLTDATTPATGARSVVSFSFFCAVAT